MNVEMQLLWHEIAADLKSPVVLWQLGVLALVLASAYAFVRTISHRLTLIQGAFARGIENILFPLTVYGLLLIARIVLHPWMHVGILRIVLRLVLAMLVIRLIVHILRYVFSPSVWLHSFEKMLAWSIWGLFALHVTGALDPILLTLEEITFSVGKQKLNLLLLIQGLITVIVTLLLSLWLSRMLELKLMAAESISSNMRVIMVKIVRMLAIVLALMLSLSAVGIDLTMLSVFGGALGVGLGFGLQKIASNYVSGFIILMDKSMHMGDIITISNHYGVVKELRSRYMILSKLDGTQVIIPNEHMITDVVINHTSAAHKARIAMVVQVAYDSDLDRARKVMHEIGLSHPRTIKDSPVHVLIKGFAESGIDLELSVWIADPEEGSALLQSDIYYALWQRFKQEGIQIPYPQREVRMVSAAHSRSVS